MSRYEEVVNFWLEEYIEDKSKYRVSVEKTNNFYEITIFVDKNLMGKIIGKNGNIITSIRNFINGISKKDSDNVKVLVKEL